ncbi:MAG TPA: hypothetical protein VFT98_02390 [Myxococcota bacterium]|nr:hypothetical protein [Myxococcota bacterium]
MLSNERRRFDHFAVELSLALGVRVPRHSLWIAVAGRLGCASELARFCDAPLDDWLRSQRLGPLLAQCRGRILREVQRFDPARRTPEEIIGALFASA